MTQILNFIQALNPLPYVLKLLPPKVAREVSVVLVLAAGVLVIAGRLLFPQGPVHDVVDGVLAVLAALGIRANVTPVADPRLPVRPVVPVPARKVN